MHIHILGICGTFMGGLALLARAAGHRVTGCDAQVYPPMSTQLEAQGIELIDGYSTAQLDLAPDIYVIGNVIKRGNPLMEAILDRGLPYISGPQWLSEHVLANKWVLAVAGTHGKTTTASMLAWVLEAAGLNPSFLIGGVPLNFGISARLNPDSNFFVIEADEYDTAFFDKRSKFVHYRPRTVTLNNLEYDHADIFADLAAIETQFHHLVRIVPASGKLLVNGQDEALQRVIERGCWSELEYFEAPNGWQAQVIEDNAGAEEKFAITWQEQPVGAVNWTLQGAHNRCNALAAIAAARHLGVPPEQGAAALSNFQGVKRRMEVRGNVNGITLYDDFAHHPTAIGTTIAGLRARIGDKGRILAILEPRSNTMKLGTMKALLLTSLAGADLIFGYSANDGRDAINWDLALTLAPLGEERAYAFHDLEQLINAVATNARAGDHILVMSNGGFGGIHEKLLTALANAE